MTTQEIRTVRRSGPHPSANKGSTGAAVWIAGAWLGFLGLIAVNARMDAVSRASRNPNVEGRPASGRALFGFDHWLGHLAGRRRSWSMSVLIVVFVVAGGGTARSPVLLMVLVTTLIVWQDPIMNWSPYAVYNPQLLHWPEYWPLIMLSPTVEPFIVFGYVTFYFGPYFPAIWILRKMQATRGP